MAKRFYETTGVKAQDDAFVVTLDGRILKTPGKQALTFAEQFRAELVATEWDAQIDEIKPEFMPCTRLMNVACELTPSRRPDLVQEFRKYCGTDLLCYRAESPQDLSDRQAQDWQPVLDWAQNTHGIALVVTSGISAAAQPEISLKKAAEYADTLCNARLTLLVHFTATLGSALLALALMERHLDIERAYALSRLDEVFQNERWGEDEEAAQRAQIIYEEMVGLSQLI